MKKTRKIILMLDSSRAVDRGIIRGIVKYSHLRGNWSFDRFKPLFQTYPFSPKHADSILLKLNRLDADGIIGYLPAESKLQKNIIQHRFPAVVIPVKNLIEGLVNIHQGPGVGTVGAEYLLGLGFRHFAFCGTNDVWSQVRGKYFKLRIEQAGFDVSIYPSSVERKRRESELNRLVKWLVQLRHPLGIMACNDERSSDVADACDMAGLNIPDQVAILGVDNDEMICSLSSPSLSSIKLNPETVGYQAAEVLDSLITGGMPPDYKIAFEPTGIVTRQSTDILAIDDREVVQAVRFIRSNARRNIRVGDVVAQTCLSVRALQQRFRQAIGCSITQEIHHVRIRQMADLLINTNQSVSQIAHDLAFNYANHISRAFRKEMGMTPIEYRRHFGHKHPKPHSAKNTARQK